MTEADRITWALEELDPATYRMQTYAKCAAYYQGMHNLAFATEKFKATFWKVFKDFSLNLCASVVDIQTERLEVVGFTSSEASHKPDTNPADDNPVAGVMVDDPSGKKAWDAWERNRLDLVADEVHASSFLYGDGFLVAQPSEGGLAVWPQSPFEMAVHYADTVPATLDLAAKLFGETIGGKTYWTLYIYTPGRVQRYTLTTDKDVRPQDAKKFSGDGRVDFSDPEFMPVYHFPNKALGEYGISELRDVFPLQDALNKTVIDMLVSSEYQAFRQRWATGVEDDEPPDQFDATNPDSTAPQIVYTDGDGTPIAVKRGAEHGPGSFLLFADPNSRVGEFGQSDVSPYVQVKNAFQADVARVSGVPLSYFFVSTSETPSGEALKAAEIRFQRKGRRQKRSLGNHWEHVIAAIAGVGGDVDLNAVWEDDSPRSETEKLNALVLKESIGVPQAALWKEMGYDDDEIAAFAAMTPPPSPKPTSPDPTNPAPPPPTPPAKVYLRNV